MTKKIKSIIGDNYNYPMAKTEIGDIINIDKKKAKINLEKNKIKGPEFDKNIPREYYSTNKRSKKKRNKNNRKQSGNFKRNFK